ncbi:hypothetical protein Fcan01_20434 [Folsomia candida]|uniref:Uncharacterized protein n=1 Tax=Folsomia candida TaxID=158441 RepID=A0A226DGM6_FOLCA|nr:hypothetical protein Fcan01_20434 [Folsomia candida]
MGDILVPRGMWKLFNIFLKQYQKVSIVPYSFDFWLGRNIVVLLDLPKWKKFLLKASTVWMISHTLLCYCFAILKFTRVEIDVVQGSKNDHQFQELRSFVLFTLSMYSSAMIGVSVTTSFTPSVCSKVLNATIKFEEKFNLFVAAIAVTLNLDPLGYLLPTKWSITFPFARIILLTQYFVETGRSSLGLMIIGFIVMSATIEATSQLHGLVRSSADSFRLRGKTRLIIKLYQELQLWNQFTNESFCYFAIPPIFFFGTALVILVNYGTIRLYDTTPGMIYPLIPFCNAVALIFLVILLPQAARAKENSSKLFSTLRKQFVSKYEKRVAKSLRPIGIACGPVGMISNKWAGKVMEVILNYSVTLLLTF